MATHTLVYYGYFDAKFSFHRLVPGQTRCWKADGTEGAVDVPPEPFDGLRFGFMETRHGFLITQVDTLLLRAPVLFIGGRHGPKGPGPQWSKLDDDSAARILVDAIVANPEHRDVLAEEIRRLGQHDQDRG